MITKLFLAPKSGGGGGGGAYVYNYMHLSSNQSVHVFNYMYYILAVFYNVGIPHVVGAAVGA
jgi:hypothetical protein